MRVLEHLATGYVDHAYICLKLFVEFVKMQQLWRTFHFLLDVLPRSAPGASRWGEVNT